MLVGPEKAMLAESRSLIEAQPEPRDAPVRRTNMGLTVSTEAVERLGTA